MSPARRWAAGNSCLQCYVPGTRGLCRASRARWLPGWNPLPNPFPGNRVEEERRSVRESPHAVILEGEHVVEASGDAVEAARNAGQPPVALDELDDRGLAGQRVRDVVLLRPRRDHHHRQARAVTAAALLAGQRVAAAAR